MIYAPTVHTECLLSPQASGSAQQEFTVRIAKNQNKNHSILKFNESNNVDFTKCGSAKLERENNLKEFKTAHDIDVMPKYGAGSEFGRDQREETRKRKYGIMTKRYKPEDQPWLLKLGSGKQSRKFKGTKEGSVSENASYYIFTQCPDGAFEASPVDSWYNFAPIIKYKYLNSDEAEEEFTRRDRTLNYFSVMVKKRLKNDTDEPDEAEAKAKVFKKKKNKKDFMLTEMDEWADISDDDDDDDDNSDNPEKGSGDDDAPKKKKAKGGKKKKGKIEGKKNSDDEAVEESDSFDEGGEIDYMTSSDSDDDVMYANNKDREDSNKYSEKGVEDEDGLRKLNSSDEEEEEQQKQKTREEEEEEGEGEAAEKTKEADKSKDSDSSSSSSSESDSDPEKDSNFASAFFLEKKKKKSAPQRRPSNESEGSKSAPGSRSATPTKSTTETPPKTVKKKIDTESPLVKKPRLEQSSSSASLSGSAGNEGVTEETVRRYLMRKPMTAVELLQKFKSKNTGMSKQAMVTTIANIVKKLNPEKTKVKDKMYLFIKKKE